MATGSADPVGAAATRDTVPVTPARHGGRFWRRFRSWDFARAHRLVPIVLGEHEQVAASLPILFVQTGAGPWPVALTRLTGTGTGALVSPSGRWRGSYVPSILRVHPFGAARDETGDIRLLVDESSGLVTDAPEDEPFFDADGTPAPALAKVIGFFRERTAAETRTRAAVSEMAARVGFVPFSPPKDLAQMDASGLFVPDRSRLDGLSRTDLGVLHRCGALALAQVQAVSLHHLPFLAAAEAQLERASDPRALDTADPTGEDAAISGFLDALAVARDHDPRD